MKNPRFSKYFAPIAAGLFSALLAGCASWMEPQKPEVAVKARATALLKAKMAGDFEKAYNMTAPSYRAVAKLFRYRAENSAAPGWTGAEVIDVSCEEPTKCSAKVRIDFKPLLGVRFGDTISTHVDETWLTEDGQWWLFPRL